MEGVKRKAFRLMFDSEEQLETLEEIADYYGQSVSEFVFDCIDGQLSEYIAVYDPLISEKWAKARKTERSSEMLDNEEVQDGRV